MCNEQRHFTVAQTIKGPVASEEQRTGAKREARGSRRAGPVLIWCGLMSRTVTAPEVHLHVGLFEVSCTEEESVPEVHLHVGLSEESLPEKRWTVLRRTVRGVVTRKRDGQSSGGPSTRRTVRGVITGEEMDSALEVQLHVVLSEVSCPGEEVDSPSEVHLHVRLSEVSCPREEMDSAPEVHLHVGLLGLSEVSLPGEEVDTPPEVHLHVGQSEVSCPGEEMAIDD
ncbi:hypothetical protein WMY93_000136 [Mugilogobius chulae]|uniref:Uncharacterized protein n=1 Tax=Mugilogobius chulae TaxID=88201 RepID=A0AAW0PZF4_9GOBI